MSEPLSAFETLPEERFLRLDGRIPFISTEVVLFTAEGTELAVKYDLLSLASAIECARRKNPGCTIITARRRVDLPEEEDA